MSDDLKLRQKRAVVVVKVLNKLYPNPSFPLDYTTPLELLVAVVLSARCTDKKVNEVTRNLFIKYKNLDDYANADINEFSQDIKSTGFYKNKAKNIIAAAKKIRDEYDSSIPNDMERLTSLPGIARKSANVILSRVFKKSVGIAVDTHVIRLSQKFGLTENKDQNRIENDLMEAVPKAEWMGFTVRMGHYGRDYSPAHKKNESSDPVSIALIDKKLI